MSVEIDDNIQGCSDDLASTSLLSSNNNHNNANALPSRSRQKTTDSEPHKVHFNIVEDGAEKRQKSAFVRDIRPNPKSSASTDSSPNSGGLASRLSMAIRRSLRLGPKQRSTAAQSPTKDEHRAFRFGDDKNVFTSFTDLRKEPCDISFGSIAELQYMLQMNRKVQIKKFVRHNDWPISHEIRVDLWRCLCMYQDFETNKILYNQQLANLVKTGVKTIQPAFLSSDGIVVHDHGLKQQGAIALQRVLIVIECVRPELRFVPIIYPMCAVLLHYMNAEETFSAMIRFLNTSSNFLIQSDVSLYASLHTLLALLKKHRRSAYNFLKRRVGSNDDATLAEVFRPWCEWIFKQLPFDFLVRITDCFLIEGHKMLLRVALSLVYLWYKQRVKAGAPTASGASTPESRVEEISAQIAVLCQNCPVSVQTLLDMGFAIRNFKHSTINSLQKQFEDKYREQIHRDRKSDQIIHAQQRNMYTAAFESNIIDTDSACELMCALPSRFQLETPVLLFRLSEHGASFTQLWTQIDEAEQSLFVIRSTSGEIFGAYCSACWCERKDVRERAKTRYFGTGESFVFKQPKGQLYPTIFNWIGRNNEQPDNCPQHFMAAGDKFLIIGSGGGDAIAIRDELTHGLSFPCDTFGSTSLVSSTSFEIDELEVYQVASVGAI